MPDNTDPKPKTRLPDRSKNPEYRKWRERNTPGEIERRNARQKIYKTSPQGKRKSAEYTRSRSRVIKDSESYADGVIRSLGNVTDLY